MQGEGVKNTRADAVGNVLADLEAFQIHHQSYFDDLEPRSGWPWLRRRSLQAVAAPRESKRTGSWVVGFEREADARRFWDAMRQRLEKPASNFTRTRPGSWSSAATRPSAERGVG